MRAEHRVMLVGVMATEESRDPTHGTACRSRVAPVESRNVHLFDRRHPAGFLRKLLCLGAASSFQELSRW
jgi:hypothetical protein